MYSSIPLLVGLVLSLSRLYSPPHSCCVDISCFTARILSRQTLFWWRQPSLQPCQGVRWQYEFVLSFTFVLCSWFKRVGCRFSCWLPSEKGILFSFVAPMIAIIMVRFAYTALCKSAKEKFSIAACSLYWTMHTAIRLMLYCWQSAWCHSPSLSLRVGETRAKMSRQNSTKKLAGECSFWVSVSFQY